MAIEPTTEVATQPAAEEQASKEQDKPIIPLPENMAGKDTAVHVEKFRTDFMKDLEHRRSAHKKMNYHYLQYKGILWLNNVYGEEYLRSVGLQVFVPRSFATVESVRPYLSGRPLDIQVSSEQMQRKVKAAKKTEDFVKSAWQRAKANWAKADAEFYALLFGNGYLLSRYVDDYKTMPMYDGMEKNGSIKWKDGRFQRYRGMRLESLNPYNVIPDRDATGDHNWKRCYLYSIWDFDDWKDYCEMQGFSTEGMEKGGHLEEFDIVRRKIDTIYGATNVDLRTRDNGTLTSNVQIERSHMDMENKIMVVERFTEEEYSVCSGANWTNNYRCYNPDPDKIIPIKIIKDVHIPDEFDGMGEVEIIRWQQYEENKVHNLAYMATLMSTVQRYGIVESMLVDPTEASFTNPLKWIKMKNIPGVDINKAIVQLNQKSSNDVPLRFLEAISQIRQEVSGISTYITSSNNTDGTDTLGEANMMRMAGMERIKQKIYEIEERDLIPVLEHWIACIPQYYTEELDLLMNDGEDFYVKFLPFDREFNDNMETVVDISTKEGITGAQTLEEVYAQLGYRDTIFVSDLIGRFVFTLRTASAADDREKTLKQLTLALDALIKVNEAAGYQAWDVVEFGAEILRQFPTAVKDVDTYRKPEPQPQPTQMNPGGGNGNLPGPATNNGQPNGLPNKMVEAASQEPGNAPAGAAGGQIPPAVAPSPVQ